MHYFDRDPKYPTPTLMDQRRMLGLPRGRRHAAHDLAAALRRMEPRALAWWARYHLGEPGDAWYRGLFARAGGRVTGEISPSYCLLEPEDVAQVRALLPGVQVFLTLRDPIERDWSQLRYVRGRGKRGPLDTEADMIDYLDTPHMIQRGDPWRCYTNWAACFPERQLHVLFYEDIEQTPDDVLARVYAALGLPDPPGERGLTARNTSHSSEIPPAIERHLARRHEPMLRSLSERFGGHTNVWLERAQHVLAQIPEGVGGTA